MATPTTEHEAPWWADRWLTGALATGLLLRVLPMVLWLQTQCIRDECIYQAISRKIVAGKGLTVAVKGWLPAPGYPYLLATFKSVFGTLQAVKGLQIALGVASIWLIYQITKRVAGKRTAQVAAWLFAANPTLAWFTNTLWIETVYIACLLVAGLALLVARERPSDWRAAAGSGVALGIAVLFRGIATYLPPLFLLALVWPSDGSLWDRDGWRDRVVAYRRSIAGFLVAMVVVVSPWSIYASNRYGGFMVSDATVGHVMFLGNNDFEPLTFDYGNGMLTQGLFARHLRTGRRPCDRKQPPVQSSRCEVEQAIGWAKRNPGEFLGRVPLRLAQNLNPHSFLTRHVRWGYWPGLPWYLKEALVVLIVAFSLGATALGTAAAWSRARGPWAVIAIGIAVYTMAVTAVMYGMTRFRLPVEALWTVYLAMFLVDPRGVVRDLAESPWRLTGALLTLPTLLALSMWFFPTGWPMFWR